VTALGTNFRECTKLQEAALPKLGPSDILVKNHFLGINASDVNFSSGIYLPGVQPPFDAGFEAIGEVVEAGEKSSIPVGSPVAYSVYGAFADFKIIDQKSAFPIPNLSVEYLPLLVSGLTASIALERVGELKSKETVLVTAAAGGTGLFAVQLAKLAGNHVIGTVSSTEKVEFLKNLGCDRVINYKTEDLNSVLKKEYPNGVDIVYESVGGEIFNACLNNLAVKGRLIVIGSIAGYKDGSSWKSGDGPMSSAPISTKLLSKSASLRGFYMNHFISDFKRHTNQIISLMSEKKLKSIVDQTKSFSGLESIYDAVDHMYAGGNIGKAFVSLPTSL